MIAAVTRRRQRVDLYDGRSSRPVEKKANKCSGKGMETPETVGEVEVQPGTGRQGEGGGIIRSPGEREPELERARSGPGWCARTLARLPGRNRVWARSSTGEEGRVPGRRGGLGRGGTKSVLSLSETSVCCDWAAAPDPPAGHQRCVEKATLLFCAIMFLNLNMCTAGPRRSSAEPG